jgi:integrase/recombinase XerD
MTPLRQRMIEDLQLRGFSARTQECYVAAVRQLAAHYHTRPDRLSEEDLRRYFLYLANEKKVARATATIALCGIKFFYEQTLQRTWTTLRFVRPPREKKLPVVLSRDEVRRILAELRIPVYRACLTTIYACGLRLLEGAQLQVPDVDSGRMVLHIHGKGKQDRYVPLADPTLAVLQIGRAHV